MENPTFKYEKIELLVCIYEILGELVFKYGTSGCSRCLTLETIMNPHGKALKMGQTLTFIGSSAFKARLEQAEVLKS